jgi:signal peptidase II
MKRIIQVLSLVVIMAGLVGCDHATKNHAERSLSGGGASPLVGDVLELRYAQNRGFAFNVERLLPDVPPNTMVVSVRWVMVVILLAVWWAYRREGWLLHGAFALTLSGALGNLIDGMARGYVVDFLHLKGWPVFNLADVYIVMGSVLLMLAVVRSSGNRNPDPA